MFCLATKILTYLPFFYLIIFMTSNCQDALGAVYVPKAAAKKHKQVLKVYPRHKSAYFVRAFKNLGATTIWQ